MVVNGILSSWIACVGSTVASELYQGSHLHLGPRIIALAVAGAANWLAVGFALSIQTGESLPTIMRHNFTTAFYSAFTYFALAALLISYVLDGSLEGYFLASVVCGLSLALTDTIAGRRVRRVLEEELSDADRHLFHSRAVEGVVHNLRNHIANALGYLREIDSRRLDPVDRESLETATAAANDAVTVLRDLSQGATPRVAFATEPVDLNELVSRAVGMARPRARTKEVQLAVRETADEVSVRADPLLMREVITNLLNNAIDAVAQGGVAEVPGELPPAPLVSRRVVPARAEHGDDPATAFHVHGEGAARPVDERHHLFEPHFTTKEGGTGLGLFMSYGIVREHQGQLLFEGNRRGAVFTVVLPPFAAALALRA